MRANHDKDIKNKEAELATLKGKLKVLEQTSGAGAKRLTELKQEHEETVKSTYIITINKANKKCTMHMVPNSIKLFEFELIVSSYYYNDNTIYRIRTFISP